jgi:hypothetical protein
MGGNCKTTFFAMVSPSVDSFSESVILYFHLILTWSKIKKINFIAINLKIC